MKQMKKTNRGWKFSSILPLAGFMAITMGWAAPAIAGPDLKVRVGVDVRSVQKNANRTYNFTIRGELKNVGNADYVSQRNQQTLVLYQVGRSNRRIASWPFSRLNRGQIMKVRVPVRNQSRGRRLSYKLALSFDPDIYLDGNPANDDRNSRNNQAILSRARLSSALLYADRRSADRRPAVAVAGPDLQVRVRVDERSVHQNANGTYNFTIRGQLKNVGNADYVPQQKPRYVLFLHQVGRSHRIASWQVNRLNRGQVMKVHVPVINQPGGQSVPSYELVAVPILLKQPRPGQHVNNLDRNPRNNQATLRSRTLSGAFARAALVAAGERARAARARASRGVRVRPGVITPRPVGVRPGVIKTPSLHVYLPVK